MAASRLVLPSQQPVLSTGLPYAGGQLFFYLSGTSTLTPTYQDSGLSTPNTNPVILDSSGNIGNVFLNQSIVYKVVLEDANGNLVWSYDPVYPLAPATVQGLVVAGTSTGTANAQVLGGVAAPTQGQTILFTAGFSNSGALTLNTGNGALPVYQPGASGPQLLVGGEVVTPSSYLVAYEAALNGNAGGWQLLAAFSLNALGVASAVASALLQPTPAAVYAALGGVAPMPQGRLTLTTATPVMAVSSGTGAASIIYTPYLGNNIPSWTGSAFANATCGEISQALSDTVNSPAAAVAGSVYDMFVWFKSGVATLSRGPVWTNATTRALALSRVSGILVNASSITNGPAAGYGVYVGTVATDAGGATVTFNPQPAAASGGPTNGAWIGLWNQYNRVPVAMSEQDSKATWTWSTASWHAADASNNNRLTLVSGNAEDSIFVLYTSNVTSTQVGPSLVGVGLDSVTAPSGGIGAMASTTSSDNSLTANYSGTPLLGQHYFQALESGIGNGTQTWNGGAGYMQLSGQFRF